VELLVFKYLSNLYYLKSFKNQVLDRWSNSSRIYGDELIREVFGAFDITYGSAAYYVEVWIKRESPTFDVKKFWEEKRNIFSDSVIGQIDAMAQTLAQDMVPVQPMPAPKSDLFYLDYQYDDYRVPTFSPETEHEDAMGNRFIRPAGIRYEHPDNFIAMSGTSMI